jgi:peptidyl-prolyl cis-trans isomerase D
MLQAIRDRAQGFFAWVLLILIGVPFALWGIQNYFDSGRESPVAVVGDRDIFERDVTRVYEQALANLPPGSDFDEKHLKRQTLDRLIDEELIGQAAIRTRLHVGDDAVRQLIETLPYFQTDGKFDKEKYKTMLASQNMAPGQFSEQLRRALVLEQYQRAVSDSALVADWQAQNFYRLRNQQREIEYVAIPLQKVDRPADEQAIAAFYEAHRSDFVEPERVTVDYVALSLDELAHQVTPTEDELKAFYEEQKGSFTSPEQRRLSHILVSVESGNAEADAAALKKIREVREKLVSGEDFAKLAREVSDDKESGAKGGDLGFVAPGSMDPNFEKVGLALAKDVVSEPVRTPFGYHLIKVTDLRPSTVKGFAEVKAELARMYQRNAVDSRFYELGQKLTEMSFENPDSLEPAARAVQKPVERSAPFTRDTGEGIAAEKGIRDAAFSDDVLNGKNSDLIELGPEKVAVVRVYDHKPAVQRPLAAVRGEIIQRLAVQQAKENTRIVAEQLLKKLEGGSTLADEAKAAKLALIKPAAFRRDATDLPRPVVEAVFKAPRPKEKPVRAKVELKDGSEVVYILKSVIEPMPAQGDKEAENFRAYLAASAGQQQFAAWLGELRKSQDVYIAPRKD